MKRVLLLVGLGIGVWVEAQWKTGTLNETTIKVLSNGSTRPALFYIPTDFTANPNKKYPIIFHGHGMGECSNNTGNNVWGLANEGLIKNIYTGTKPTGYINGAPVEAIVIAPQDSIYGVRPAWFNTMLSYVFKTFEGRIDSSRIYLEGYSAAGWEVIGSIANQTDTNNRKFISALWAMSPATQDLDWSHVHDIGKLNIPVFLTAGDVNTSPEVSYKSWMLKLKASIDSFATTNKALYHLFPGDNHCCWASHIVPDNTYPELGNINQMDWLFSKQNRWYTDTYGNKDSFSTSPASYTSIPVKIEAESYTNMSGVQIEQTGDGGGGQVVGWIDTKDWMDYNVNADSAGTYTLNFRVASPNSGGQVQLKSADGNILTTVSAPTTGGWDVYTTISTIVTLPAGKQTLRIYASNGGWSINWLEFKSEKATPSTALALSKKQAAISLVAGKAYKHSLELYPNPVSEILEMEYNDKETGKVTIDIYNGTGVLFQRKEFEKKQVLLQNKLDLSSLLPGAYFIIVTINKERKEVKEFIKQ
jgi:Carbohydrate binding module (family 6)/Secretion system C-terminal sorting domain